MYSLIALLGGAAAKIYDDIEDNNLLQKFRNNTLMEFLKGIHYISFMSLSIEEPIFFIISYLHFFLVTETVRGAELEGCSVITFSQNKTILNRKVNSAF